MLNKIEFEAYIDPDNKFEKHDKFSQVKLKYLNFTHKLKFIFFQKINTLQQLENIKHFDIFKSRKVKVDFHALWFDVYSGNVYMFSMKEKCFIKIDHNTQDSLMKEYAQN